MSNRPSSLLGNVMITGVTGFIGRHLLYEYVRYFLENQIKGNIYILLRSKKLTSAGERLERILTHEYAPDYFKRYSYETVAQKIKIVEGSLEDRDLGDKMKQAIPINEKLYIIHNAGSVNLFNNPKAAQEVNQNNFGGTQNLLTSSKMFPFKFVFISTAFSCGIVKGTIGDDYSIYKNNVFRNPYEQCKNITEKMVEDYCSKMGREYQILRPSVVCGRLLDAPLYYTSKFDVIYGWTKFFWNLKEQGATDQIRIQMAANSKINVVPVDFVSKSVVALFSEDICHANIIYPESLSNRRLYAQMLSTIEFANYIFVDKSPVHLNKSEKFYYRLIDKVYSPYLNQCDNEYDTKLLKERLGNTHIKKIDLSQLTRFAIDHEFNDLLIN